MPARRTSEAVVVGLEKTGRLVTAAGLIMFAAFIGLRGRVDRRPAAIRLRPRGRDPDRRHDRPLAPRARGDEAVRPVQLVAAGGGGQGRSGSRLPTRRAPADSHSEREVTLREPRERRLGSARRPFARTLSACTLHLSSVAPLSSARPRSSSASSSSRSGSCSCSSRSSASRRGTSSIRASPSTRRCRSARRTSSSQCSCSSSPGRSAPGSARAPSRTPILIGLMVDGLLAIDAIDDLSESPLAVTDRPHGGGRPDHRDRLGLLHRRGDGRRARATR